MSDKEVGHLPQWLVKGEEDPFKDYLERPRDNLPLADYTDDQLANLVFMIGDRSKEDDMRMMLDAHRRGEMHISQIGALTAAKERIRWLSRQLLIAEGKYPGKEKGPQIDAEKVWEHILRNDQHLRVKPWSLRWTAIQVLPEEYVDEKMQSILADLIDRNVIDEKGFEVPPVDATPKWAGSQYLYRMPPTKAEREAAEYKARVEERAEQIYNSWHMRAGFSPWVPGGNSDHQVEARRQAIGQLAKEQEEPKDA